MPTAQSHRSPDGCPQVKKCRGLLGESFAFTEFICLKTLGPVATVIFSAVRFIFGAGA